MFEVDLSFLNWNFISSLVICPTIEPLSSWLSLFLWAILFHVLTMKISVCIMPVSDIVHVKVMKFSWCIQSYDLERLIICGRSDCSALALDAPRLTKSGILQKGVREMLYATTPILTIFGAALTPLTIWYH